MKDQRVKLSNPTEVKINDRLARNGEHIVRVELLDQHVILHTRWDAQQFLLSEPVWVWRYR